VILTEAGVMVRDLAQSMARYGGSIMREVAGHDDSHAGRVRLAAPDGIAGFLLAPRLAQFQMSNPQVQLSIDCGLWIGSMLEAEPDLYLEMTEAYSPDLVSMPIATLHYAAFASREYLDLYGTPKSIAELTEHRTIRHTSHREQRSTWNPKAAAIGQLAQNHFISNSSAATFQAVRAGAGIASLPTYVTTIAPELVMLDLGAWGHPVLFLRHHGAIEQKRRVKLVRDWLQEVFDPTNQPWFRSEFIHPDDFGRYTRREAPGSVERKGVRRIG
jgi:DNA-binding transcriptional LysR family regulator